MKIQAIRKACMDTGAFYIFNCADGRQFISNGQAAWPVEGITLTAGILPALFDIEEKKLQKLAVRELPVPDESRFTLEPMEQEEALENLGLVWDCGTFYRVLRGEKGLLFIDAAWTKPAENKEGGFAYALREREGREPLIACYGDMLVGAVVMPAFGGAVVERIRKLAAIPQYRLSKAEEEGYESEA